VKRNADGSVCEDCKWVKGRERVLTLCPWKPSKRKPKQHMNSITAILTTVVQGRVKHNHP
jgi:ribosomal protein L36